MPLDPKDEALVKNHESQIVERRKRERRINYGSLAQKAESLYPGQRKADRRQTILSRHPEAKFATLTAPAVELENLREVARLMRKWATDRFKNDRWRVICDCQECNLAREILRRTEGR